MDHVILEEHTYETLWEEMDDLLLDLEHVVRDREMYLPADFVIVARDLNAMFPLFNVLQTFKNMGHEVPFGYTIVNLMNRWYELDYLLKNEFPYIAVDR